MDSIDAVIVMITKDKIKLIETYSHPIDDNLRKDILDLCHPGDNAINRMGQLDVRLGRLFAQSVEALLEKAGMEPNDIAAIGSHGQNIRHMPEADIPFTMQIGDPNIIAATTGITTVADFRRRDVALGGQGAPLTPAFHRFLFQRFPGIQWILNIGGIANVTLINPDDQIIGYDTGPGNTLMDAWYFQHTGKRFDRDGEWARTGAIHSGLLKSLSSDPFFARIPPKSTGLEHFNLKWLMQHIRQLQEHIPSEDIQATLSELTAITIAENLNRIQAKYIWACGGGAKNRHLMDRLQMLCPTTILSTDAVGIPIDWIEACAFAWFAYQTQHHIPSNIPTVTGASEAAILGAIYCA
jgi:anhydro-N-acetylmuramic acid kinase